jgi:lipopolysaccharide export system permease protein
MILWELVKVFLLSLVGITGILLMAGIVSEATQHGLGPGQIIAVIPLIIPSTLPYTIPATTLFATCVVYGRLSSDNEIIAIKAAGIHLFHVVWPGMLLGLVMSGTTLALYYETIPYTHRLMRTMFLSDVEDVLYFQLKKEGCLNQPRFPYVIFVKGVQGRVLKDAIFKRRTFYKKKDARGGYDMVARAQEAELKVNMEQREVHVLMRHCWVVSGDEKGQVYFVQRVWTVPLPPDVGGRRKVRPGDLTWEEILDRQEEILREQERLETQIAMEQARHNITGVPDTLPQHIKNLKSIKRQASQELFGLDVELHQRPAIALGCLFFVLVGCPVGIWFSRGDYLSAFVTCFLPIVFVYYPLLLCGTNFAKSGRLDPLLALWSPNALLAGAALFLFHRLLRN